jgi:hypothetical protein
MDIIQIASRAWATSCTLPEVRMLVIQFLLKNPELFKQDGSGTKHSEVLKFMMETGYMPDKPIRTKEIK